MPIDFYAEAARHYTPHDRPRMRAHERTRQQALTEMTSAKGHFQVSRRLQCHAQRKARHDVKPGAASSPRVSETILDYAADISQRRAVFISRARQHFLRRL